MLPLQGQTEPGSDGNKEVVRIPQSPSITGASPSDCLVLYSGHSFGKSYPSAKMQLVYSTGPANWAKNEKVKDTRDDVPSMVNNRLNMWNNASFKVHVVMVLVRPRGFRYHTHLCLLISSCYTASVSLNETYAQDSFSKPLRHKDGAIQG